MFFAQARNRYIQAGGDRRAALLAQSRLLSVAGGRPALLDAALAAAPPPQAVAAAAGLPSAAPGRGLSHSTQTDAERRAFLLSQVAQVEAAAAAGTLDALLNAAAPQAVAVAEPPAASPPQAVAAPAVLPGLARAAAQVAELAPSGQHWKVYGGLAAAALAGGHAAALRAWHIVRAVDTQGEGRVTAAEARRAVRAWLSKDDTRRGLVAAEAVGLLRQVRRRRDGEAVMLVAGLRAAAEALGADTVGAVPVPVPAGKARKLNAWKGALWKSVHAGRGENAGPISRATLEAVTGVPERTQRRYERRAGVRVTRNYAREELPAEPGAVRDVLAEHRLAGRSAWVVRGRRGASILSTLPNSYEARAAGACRGQTRKVNRELARRRRAGAASCISAEGQHSRPPARVFCHGAQTAARAAKRLTRAAGRPRVAFTPAAVPPTRTGGRLWRAV